jgi:hypothetical protein
LNESELRGLFQLAGFTVERLWQLPNGYVGVQEPLTDEQIEKDRPGQPGVVGVFPEHSDGVVRAWMADYRWRHARPAWLVKTRFGLIEVTPRKRVLAIEWAETPARIIITEDDVTKHLSLVHAYTTTEALKYLTALRIELERLVSVA